jgi:hypothetical protein
LDRVEQQVDQDLLSDGGGAHEEIARLLVVARYGDSATRGFLRHTQESVTRKRQSASGNVSFLSLRTDCTARDGVTETRMRERDVDRIFHFAARDLALCAIEPPEYDG